MVTVPLHDVFAILSILYFKISVLSMRDDFKSKQKWVSNLSDTPLSPILNRNSAISDVKSNILYWVSLGIFLLTSGQTLSWFLPCLRYGQKYFTQQQVLFSQFFRCRWWYVIETLFMLTLLQEELICIRTLIVQSKNSFMGLSILERDRSVELL